VAANYASAVSFINTTDLNNPDLNAILGRPLRLISHPVQVFSNQIDPNYMAMREWVSVEMCAPCGSGIDVNTCIGEEEEEF
jgi:hypothetical protein